MQTYTLDDLVRSAAPLPLVSNLKQGSFFEQPEWFALVEKCLAGSGTAATVAVAGDGRTAIVCCQQLHEGALRSCTNLYTPGFNLLGETSDIATVRAFARELAVSHRRLEFIQLEGLNPADASFGALLNGLRSAGWVAKPYFGWAVWRECVAGTDFQHYVLARDSRLRKTWKRKRTLLANSAAARWQFYHTGDDPAALIGLYEDVRRRSWKGPEPFPDFIPDLIRFAAEAGALRMGVLFIDDEPAAAQFWIVWEGRATIYKLVYAEKFAQFSPGTLLTMEMMRHVLEQDKPFEIDFGRGDDEYKRLWLSSRSERWGIEAANPLTLGGLPRSLRIVAAIVRGAIRRRIFRRGASSRAQWQALP